MPTVAKFSGWGGLVWWFLIFAISAINLAATPQAGSDADAQLDRVVLRTGLMVSLAGMAASIGMLYGRLWAYRLFLAGLGIAVIPAAVFAFVTDFSVAMVAVEGVCILGAILMHRLLRGHVRAYFGLESQQRLLLVPGWTSLAMGVVNTTFIFWPYPAPMFGVWLLTWSDGIIAAAFAVGYLAERRDKPAYGRG